MSIAIDPTGSRLVTGSGDGTARIWDTVTFADRLRARARYRDTAQRIAPYVDGLIESGTTDRVETQAAWTEREREIARQLVLARSRHENGRWTQRRRFP